VIAPPGAVVLKEGSTSLFVPSEHSIKGPGKRIGRVFYNQQMAFNRDISVLFFQAACMDCRSAFDAMSATGARGVRILNESKSKAQFVMNDKDAEAVRFIQANIELNGLEGACANQDDLRSHLAKHVYDYVDLDPFGTPAPFVQAVFQGCKRNAIVAITATDTAPLAGTHVKKCVRRYMAKPLRGVFGHEVGLRILIGYLAREAAQLDKGIEPLLSFYADHYFRIYLKLKENAAEAEHSLSQLGYLTFDPETLVREVSQEFSNEAAGPLWVAPLTDKGILDNMTKVDSLEHPVRCIKYLNLWRNELDVPFFYENNELSSFLHSSPPELERLLDLIRRHGKASRTHFSPSGFKTDLPLKELLDLYPEVS
jgi:tRNA (guanine26-N2/guanine27-N2)-dimethyltransferase